MNRTSAACRIARNAAAPPSPVMALVTRVGQPEDPDSVVESLVGRLAALPPATLSLTSLCCTVRPHGLRKQPRG